MKKAHVQELQYKPIRICERKKYLFLLHFGLELEDFSVFNSNLNTGLLC